MATNQSPRSRGKRTKSVVATNADTGEVFDLQLEEGPSRAQLKYARPEWVVLVVGLDAKLKVTKMQRAIITHLLDIQPTQGDPISHITQPRLAEVLGTTTGYVQLMLKELVLRRLVFKEGNGQYRVNPHIGWRGNMMDWDQARFNTQEPQWRKLRAPLQVVPRGDES